MLGLQDLEGGAAGDEHEVQVFGRLEAEADDQFVGFGAVLKNALRVVDGEAFHVFAVEGVEGEDDFFHGRLLAVEDAEEVGESPGDVDGRIPAEFAGLDFHPTDAVEPESLQELRPGVDADQVPAVAVLFEGIGVEDAGGGEGFLVALVFEEDGFPPADGVDERGEVLGAAVGALLGVDELAQPGVGVEGVEEVERFEEAVDAVLGERLGFGEVVAFLGAGVGDGDAEVVFEVVDVAFDGTLGTVFMPGAVFGQFDAHLFVETFEGDVRGAFDFPDDEEVTLDGVQFAHGGSMVWIIFSKVG